MRSSQGGVIPQPVSPTASSSAGEPPAHTAPAWHTTHMVPLSVYFTVKKTRTFSRRDVPQGESALTGVRGQVGDDRLDLLRIADDELWAAREVEFKREVAPCGLDSVEVRRVLDRTPQVESLGDEDLVPAFVPRQLLRKKCSFTGRSTSRGPSLPKVR